MSFAEAAAALADDAATLALLQDRELDAAALASLREINFPDNLALLPASVEARNAFELMHAAMQELALLVDEAHLDALAVDFAGIYLTGAYGASPCESVWLSDDRLVCQEAMFELRALYAAAGLAVPDWRRRPDDHLICQLQFLAHQISVAKMADDWRALAGFLDTHLLRWLPDFAARVAGRCETPFYAALVLLTHAWCQQLREHVAEHLGQPRLSRAEVEERLHPHRESAEEVAPLHFVPGAAGPSW